MKIPSCSLSVWKNLYDAATAFEDIACWEWMSDSDVFGVQNPDNGEIGYCCVLGQLGEVLGLVVYVGTEGLEQHRKIQSGKIHAGSPEMLYAQNCLTAWFGERRELDRPDLQVIKELGLKFRGKNSWPQFRRIQPGYLPWYLTESEAKYLTLSLKQAREVALCLEKDPDWLAVPNKNHYVVRLPIQNADEWRWESHAVKPAPRTKGKIESYPLDEVRLQRINKTSQVSQYAWETDAFYTPMPVDGEDRPFFPYTFLCADHESGFIFGTAMAHPSTWQTEFPSALLDAIENHKLLPRALWVRKEELLGLFGPLAARLGIKVQLTRKLPSIDRAKRALLKHLSDQR